MVSDFKAHYPKMMPCEELGITCDPPVRSMPDSSECEFQNSSPFKVVVLCVPGKLQSRNTRNNLSNK